MSEKEVLLAAYRMLSRKGYHSRELSAKLQEKGHDFRDVAKVIERCKEDGYLNDQEWIDAFIRQQQAKGNGPHLARQKLHQKGVERSEIDLALETHYTEEKKGEIVAKIWEKEEKKGNERHKIFGKIYRKGFSSSDISVPGDLEI